MKSRSEFEDLPVLLILCLAVALLPIAFLTSAFDVFGAVKYTLLVFLALLSIGVQVWLALSTGRIQIPSSRLALVLVVFLAWLALSTIFSPVAAISFFGLRKRFLGLTTYLAAAMLLAAAARVSWDKAKLSAIFYSLSGTIVVTSLIGFAQYMGSVYPFDLKDLFGRAAYSTFGNPAYFGVFLAMAMPITIYLALNGPDLRDRLVGYAGLSAAVLGLITAGSSGAVVGAIGGAGIFLVWRYFSEGRVELNATKIIAAFLLAVVLLGSVYVFTLEKTAIGQRGWIWSAGLSVAVRHPLFGTGLDNLRAGLRQLAVKPEPKSDGLEYEDAHNIWLNLAATAGWPALGLAAAFLVLTALSAISASRRDELRRRVMPALLAAGAGYLLAVQFNPEDLGSLPLLWILMGIMLGLADATTDWRFTISRAARAAGAAGGLILIAAGLFSGRTLAAEINLLRANNLSSLEAGRATFKAVQTTQPWQTQYYLFEIYRLAPAAGSLNTPTGRELVGAAQTAIAKNERDPENWLAFGELYRSIALRQRSPDLHEAALGLFKRAISLDKYNARAIRLTALTYRDLGDRQNSLNWIRVYERSFAKNAELVEIKQELLNKQTAKQTKT